MADIVLRPADLIKDKQAILNLYFQVQTATFGEDDSVACSQEQADYFFQSVAGHRQSKTGELFSAFDENETMVGQVLFVNPHRARCTDYNLVDQLSVAPDHQGKGIGSHILKTVEDLILQQEAEEQFSQSISDMMISYIATDNETSQHVFLNNGWNEGDYADAAKSRLYFTKPILS